MLGRSSEGEQFTGYEVLVERLERYFVGSDDADSEVTEEILARGLVKLKEHFKYVDEPVAIVLAQD